MTTQEILAQAIADHRSGKTAEAMALYRKVLDQDPDQVDALRLLGVCQLHAGRGAEAEALLRRALGAAPNNPKIHDNWALVLRGLGRKDEARAASRRAVELAPNEPTILINLVQFELQAGNVDAAIDLLRHILTIQPDAVEARYQLAETYELLGDAASALRESQAVAAQAPEQPQIGRKLILDQCLADGDDGSRVAEAAKAWHRRFAAPLRPARPSFTNDPDAERPLRVGFIGGGQLRAHTLSRVLLPIIAAHDSSRFKLYAYSDLERAREDQVSAAYKAHVTWQDTGALSDEALAERIRQDRIDVLIDPVAFVPGTRFLALARRPAPIQISFPTMTTCGGDTIDFVLADKFILPAEAERHFTERVLRIPFGYCQVLNFPLPPAGGLPARRADSVITFGVTNKLTKCSDRALALWKRILDRVPRSRLLIKAAELRNAGAAEALIRRLATHGIGSKRVEFGSWTDGWAEHMTAYNQMDVALDSMPFAGVTTTFDALLMGVPVVTRVGSRVLDRYGYSILMTVGFEEGITFSDDEYVERAVSLASDLDRLERWRSTLRQQVLSSPACSGASQARSLQEAIRGAWRDWCKTQRS
jgi:predicted O-linked N-acetylglucosamine transferase (SPINDLY family)